ncbi:MAG: hypothetical protein ACREMN_00060 [Gemmatimonadales bacterium]
MNSRQHAFLLVTTLLACGVTSLGAQVSQQVLAQQLLGSNRAERDRALAQVQAIGPQNIGAQLREALITLLDRSNRIVLEAEKRQQALDNYEDPEFIAHLAHVVSQLEDPRAIPALAGALGSGSTLVTDALADFGEPAVPDVVRVVTSPDSPYSAVDEGLLALRFMVEGRGGRLSARTLDRIRDAAKQRLTGKQSFTTVWQAIDLAVALRDAELRRIVESLAADGDAVAALGIDNPEIIELTRQRAAGRLAGGRMLPQYRSPEERARQLDPRRPR